MSTKPNSDTRRTWARKFGDAARGVKLGVWGQSSFLVHIPAACLVLAAATALRAQLIEWCVLLLCITVVLVAEMFNTALEWLAKAIDVRHNTHFGGALDIGSAAVLLAVAGATAVGAIVFVFRLGASLGWWAAALG